MFEKMLKKNNILLYISTLFIVITIIICIFSQIYIKKISNVNKKYEEYIFTKDSEGKNAKIDNVKNIIFLYENYYMVFTKENVYTSRLSISEVKRIREDLEKNKTTYTYGTVRKINDEIIENFITTYEKINENNKISKEEYKSKMGYYYLDQTESEEKIKNINDNTIIIAIILILLGVSLSIVFINNNNKNFNLLRTLSKTEISKIDSELENIRKDGKIFILENYIIKSNYKVDLLRYSDIDTIYINDKSNSKKDKIVIYMKDKKIYKYNIKNGNKLFNKVKNKKI